MFLHRKTSHVVCRRSEMSLFSCTTKYHAPTKCRTHPRLICTSNIIVWERNGEIIHYKIRKYYHDFPSADFIDFFRTRKNKFLCELLVALLVFSFGNPGVLGSHWLTFSFLLFLCACWFNY